MPLNRLLRHRAILRGKRQGCVDRDQYYLERADRARVERKVRVLLRRQLPVALVTPRWSQARRFLDDLATDLQLGEPEVSCRTLSLAGLEGRTPHQAWSFLVLAVTEFCELEIDGPAWKVVSRHGFRHTIKDLFARADQGRRRCLMIHGLESMHVEALRDLIDVFEDHCHHREGEGRFNLLLAGSIDAPHFEFAGVERLVLPDFAEEEALGALVEHVGVADVPRLQSFVSLVGGIPAVLDAFGTEAADRISEVIADRNAVWRALGNLALDIRRAFEIVAADESLLGRLEALARDGALPPDPSDERLLRAGLVRTVGHSAHDRRTMLRSPVLADLALAG
jgi:hypothetical protein